MAKQLTINWALKKAQDLIKADGKSSGASIPIKWKIEGLNIRTVTVNDVVTPLQEKQDAIGEFKGDFVHLLLKCAGAAHLLDCRADLVMTMAACLSRRARPDPLGRRFTHRGVRLLHALVRRREGHLA